MKLINHCGSCKHHNLEGIQRTCKLHNKKIFFHHTCVDFEEVAKPKEPEKKGLFNSIKNWFN